MLRVFYALHIKEITWILSESIIYIYTYKETKNGTQINDKHLLNKISDTVIHQMPQTAPRFSYRSNKQASSTSPMVKLGGHEKPVLKKHSDVKSPYNSENTLEQQHKWSHIIQKMHWHTTWILYQIHCMRLKLNIPSKCLQLLRKSWWNYCN